MTFRYPDKETQNACLGIAQLVKKMGGTALYVGGCVRDALLGVLSKDIDIEVYGLSAPGLLSILKSYFQVDLVGQSFGVFKIKHHDIGVSLPRRESKSGLHHTDFLVETDPNMSFRDAALRRDFTINAMGYNPLTGELVDPLCCSADLEHKILRHTSNKFVEDPLRVLRGMQFVSRFNLHPHHDTIELCLTLDITYLAPERIFQ